MSQESLLKQPTELLAFCFKFFALLLCMLGVASVLVYGSKVVFVSLALGAIAASFVKREQLASFFFCLIILSQPLFLKRLYVADPVFEIVLLVVSLRYLYRLQIENNLQNFFLLGFYFCSVLSAALVGWAHWNVIFASLPDLHFNKGHSVFGEHFKPFSQALRPLLTLSESLITYFVALHFRRGENRRGLQACLLVLIAISLYGLGRYEYVDNASVYVGTRRADSIFSGPNVFGGFLVLSSPLPIGVALSGVSSLWTALCLASFGLLVAALYLSKSLGAHLGLMGSIFFIALLQVPKPYLRRVLHGLCFLGALASIYLLHWLLHQSPQTINIWTHGRYYLWQAGFSMAQEHPLFGVGLGQYSPELRNYYPLVNEFVERKTHAHNFFVQVLGEQGCVSLGFLLGFLALSLRNIFQKPDTLRQMASCAVLGGLIHSLIDYTNLVVVLSWVFWLCLGLMNSTPEPVLASEPRHQGMGKSLVLTSLIALFAGFLSPYEASADDWQKMLRVGLKNGGAYAVDESGVQVFAHRESEKFIPASTLKVATIFAALEMLGDGYRFPTEFYSTPDGSLIVKGYGDPLLISEELEQIAGALSNSVRGVKDIILDDSYFSTELSLDGVEGSLNPYDAQNGALIANFNTVYLRRLKNGRLVSGEPQTPLVPLAEKLRKLRKGSEERFNLGFDRNLAVKYFGELLKAFLEKKGVKVKGEIRRGALPPAGKLIYTHLCPKTLYELSQHILEFSTNFGANQIFLALGAKKLLPPATYEKGSKVVTAFLKEKVGLSEFKIVEGSGLSRRNQLSARDLVILVKAFRPHESLLPLKEGFYHAKTGSLTGVNSLAGYMDVPGHGRVTFAFVVNSVVPFKHKYTLADMLYRGLAGDVRPK